MDIIDILIYIFLGLLQGFTEPIPVSSSGHLVLAREFLGVEASGLSFEIFLNTASLLAVLFIYRNDILNILKNVMRYFFKGARDEAARNDFTYTIYLIIATIPVGVLGILLKDVIGDSVSVGFVGFMLLVTGVALWLIKNKRGQKRDGELSLKDTIIVGLSQCIALLPGISRSGSTLVGAMAVGLNQKAALRFVFLLYIPVSLGTALIGFNDILEDPQFDTLFIPYICAFIAALLASYVGLKWLQGIMERGNLAIFSYYCFLMGSIAIIYELFIK